MPAPSAWKLITGLGAGDGRTHGAWRALAKSLLPVSVSSSKGATLAVME